MVDEPQPSPSHSSSSSVDGSPRPIMPGSDGPSFLVGQRDTTEDATTRSATPTRGPWLALSPTPTHPLTLPSQTMIPVI